LYFAVIAQVVEHVLGKNEVNSANLFNGSLFFSPGLSSRTSLPGFC
jgi:hypothetical protein